MSVFRCVMAFLIAALLAAPAFAVPLVDITKGNLNPMPIATPDFIGADGQPSSVGADIARVIRADLDRSGLFHSIDPASYIQKITDINVQPRMADWKLAQAQALVVGQATTMPDGRIRGDVRLWDVTGETEIDRGHEYIAPSEDWRRIAHKIADYVYEQLTGEKGYFDTQIVFVAETGPKTHRTKRLAIMDQDGFNTKFLSSGDYMVLTPRFSPTAQQITFMSFESGRPRIYLLDLDNNRQEVLGDSTSMTFSPRFMPNGTSVLLTREGGGNSEIYRMDLRTRALTRLTVNPAIDTSPSASPDGTQIVFNSDRSGSPELYTMNASDGSNVRRISFGEGRYMTPVWSPRGDLIAFTKQIGGQFAIGVMKPDGSGERILSQSYLDEGPTWSPNGRVIMFFREGAPGQGPSLWSVDLTGQNLHRVPTETDASDPAWSPLLP